MQGKWTRTSRNVPGFLLFGTVLILPTGCWPTNAAPVASFAVSYLAGPAPRTVIFDAVSSSDSDGAILTYSRDYGDGSTGSGDEVSHTYATEGPIRSPEVTDYGGKTTSTQKGTTVLPPEMQAPDPPEGGGGTCGWGRRSSEGDRTVLSDVHVFCRCEAYQVSSRTKGLLPFGAPA